MHYSKKKGARALSLLVACAMLAGTVVPMSAATQYVTDDLAAQNAFILGKGGKSIDANSDGSFDAADSAIIKRELLAPAVVPADVYYAVEAEYKNGVSENTNEGFKGSAYVNYDNQKGGYINWTVKTEAAGNYAITFRYANSSDSPRSVRITLNGDETLYWDQSFVNTAAWTTWEEATIILPLAAGTNTIKATAITSEGGPNMDYISVIATDKEAAQGTLQIIPDGAYKVEKLDRGISAVNTGKGMLVGWRLLGTDSESTEFKLYRDDSLIYTSGVNDATSYLDAQGSASSSYKVEALVGGKVVSTDTCSLKTANNYFDLKLKKPSNLTMPDGSTCSYAPNDCLPGDVDGDGQYEIIVKWNPSNAQDNSKGGYTGNVYIDCYEMDGTFKWRIDLGRNIRAGAHYTQMVCADLDSDGKAELCCKTSDGTVDGVGTVIGNGNADYRSSAGYILTGNEYYTVFAGDTGKAIDTVNYNPPRGSVSSWGDNYGNRVDRFLCALAYLDGVTPSAVTIRGYYTRMTACAYTLENGKLKEQWYFDSNNSANSAAAGNGNHNCMSADVDGDGYQEIVLGSACIDHDGSLLWSNRLSHGDAMHLSDFLPDRPGFELWYCHESAPYGSSLNDAATGETIFRYTADKDTGRCCAGNVLASNPGAEFWGARGAGLYNGNGDVISSGSGLAVNFMIYWDGDLEREVLDGTTITKYNGNGVNVLLGANGCVSCNGSKATPSMTADLFGDWREELVLPTSDGAGLRVYSTTATTKYRMTTLMHDMTYRAQVVCQNAAYNQPPNLGFYLGSEAALPDKPAVYTP